MPGCEPDITIEYLIQSIIFYFILASKKISNTIVITERLVPACISELVANPSVISIIRVDLHVMEILIWRHSMLITDPAHSSLSRLLSVFLTCTNQINLYFPLSMCNTVHLGFRLRTLILWHILTIQGWMLWRRRTNYFILLVPLVNIKIQGINFTDVLHNKS